MSERATLRALVRVLHEMRKFHSDITATHIETFLQVALNEGISSQDLMRKVNCSQSAVSRNMATLGKLNWQKGPGFDLIESMDDPADQRKKISYLTTKGRQVADNLQSILAEARTPSA